MSKQLERLDLIEENLFFIVGCGRSGTTLLKTILASHPEISIPHETMFFSGITKGIDTPNLPLDSLLDRIVGRWWIRDMDLNREKIRAHLDMRVPTWRNLFLAILSAAAPKPDAISFGEKTVGHLRYTEELLEEYCQAKVIQIIRDPRASFASFRNAPVGSNQIAPLIQDWRYVADLDCRLNQHPRYLSVRFEDLIRDPESTLRSICGFLKLSYSEDMLNFHQRKDEGFSPDQTHHENTKKPIFTSGLDRWRSQLTTSQIGLIDYFLGSEMEKLGYSVDNPPIWFPNARLFLSSTLDQISRWLIRRPMGKFREFRARLRQRSEKAIKLGRGNLN